VPRISAWCEKKVSIGSSAERSEIQVPHLQGYVSLRKRRTFIYVRNKLSNRCHVESSRGTARQNREYCSKGGNFIEGGSINEGRISTDRNETARSFMAAVRRGDKGLVEFAGQEPHAWIHHGSNMLRNALSLLAPVERESIHVRWIYGAPGVGKSRPHATLPEAYVKEPRTKWWNGYLCQSDVIIDDFGPNGIDINHLLRWFDRYKCLVENKGGMVALHATNFIVTSNFHPRDIFKWGEEVNPQLPALERRIVLEEML